MSHQQHTVGVGQQHAVGGGPQHAVGGGPQPAAVLTANDLTTMEGARAYYANNPPVLVVSDEDRNRCAHGCTNQVGLSQILANAHNACTISLETHHTVEASHKIIVEVLKDIKALVSTYLNSGGGLNATLLSRIDGQLVGLGGRLDEHAETLRSILEKVCAADAQIARIIQLVSEVAGFTRNVVEGQRIDLALMAANVETVKNVGDAVQRLENDAAETDARMTVKLDRLADRLAALELAHNRANGRPVLERGRPLYSPRVQTPMPAGPVPVGVAVNGRAVNGNGNTEVNGTHLPPYAVYDAARTTTPN